MEFKKIKVSEYFIYDKFWFSVHCVSSESLLIDWENLPYQITAQRCPVSGNEQWTTSIWQLSSRLAKRYSIRSISTDQWWHLRGRVHTQKDSEFRIQIQNRIWAQILINVSGNLHTHLHCCTHTFILENTQIIMDRLDSPKCTSRPYDPSPSLGKSIDCNLSYLACI